MFFFQKTKRERTQSGIFQWMDATLRRLSRSTSCFHLVFPHPICYIRTFPFSLSLPRSNSDPGSLVRPFFPLPQCGSRPLSSSRQWFSIFLPRLLASTVSMAGRAYDFVGDLLHGRVQKSRKYLVRNCEGIVQESLRTGWRLRGYSLGDVLWSRRLATKYNKGLGNQTVVLRSISTFPRITKNKFMQN